MIVQSLDYESSLRPSEPDLQVPKFYCKQSFKMNKNAEMTGESRVLSE